MTRTLKTLLAAAALLSPALANTAFAETSHPRLVGWGDNAAVEYGTAPRGNIVGGGAVVVTGQGEDISIRHLDASFVQTPRPGLVPVISGWGENSSVAWVPANNDRPRLANLRPANRG